MTLQRLLVLALSLFLATPAWAETVTVPSSLSVPPSDPDGGYSVTWTASAISGAQYVLEEATDPGFADSLVVYQGKATKANLKGRLAGNTYFYRVKAALAGYEDSDWVGGGNGCAVPYRVQVKTAKGGTIIPNGTVEVPVGATQTIVITPEVGYHVASVVVDGVELGAVDSVTLPDDLLPNPKNKHAIKVKFIFNSYLVTATAGEGGSIMPVGTKTFKHGKKATYTIKPNSGQSITSLLVNGQEVLPNPLPSGVYKLPLVIEEPTTIQAYFLRAEPPVDLSVPTSDDDGAYTVSWESSTTAGVSYRLEEATDNSFTTNLRTAYSGIETSAPIMGRSIGATYYYRLKAVKAGLTDSVYVVAENGCRYAGNPVTAEGLLNGAPEALALSVITFYNAISGIPADEIGIDAAGREVALTELEIEFAEDATVGEVNTILTSLGGKIAFLLENVPIVLVRLPSPGSVANLDAMVTQLESDPAVQYVRRGYFPATQAVPDNHADLGNVDKLAHHLAVRAHAAWHVKSLLSSSSPPHLVVTDKFGGGPPLANYDVMANSADFGNVSPFFSHGYHVLGIISADHEGDASARGLATGIYPGTLTLSAVDLTQHFGGPGSPQFTWAATENLILDRVRHSGSRVVLNTSIGFECDTPDQVFASCNRIYAALEAIQWIKKVRLGHFEGKFVHITAAGNTKVPGDTDAAADSPFAAARLIGDLQLENGTPVPPLDNTLVIENVTVSGSPPQPGGLHGTSKYHGDLSAVGTDVWSLTGPVSGAGADTGTSMAAPQVAGLAAYVWALKPSMGSLSVVNLLQDTSRVVNSAGGSAYPARVIDAYDAVLATDIGSGNAKVRRELLDVADGAGAPGSNGVFDDKDIHLLADMFYLQEGAIDYSRYDLNGDGRTGGDTTERFDLNLDGAFMTAVQTIDEEDIEFRETAATDEDVLCYYAYSDLYAGDSDIRDELNEYYCPGQVFPLDPRATFLHTCDDSPRETTPFSLTDLGIKPGDTIRIVVRGSYYKGGGYDDQRSTIGLFSSTNVLLDEQLLNRVPGAIPAGGNHATDVTWHCDGEQTDIPGDFNVNPSVEIMVPAGANYLFIVAEDVLYYDNYNDDNYRIGILVID